MSPPNSRRWITIGVGMVAITFLIYYTESLKLPFFATLRYLYAIPIVYVALHFGRRYGLGLALLVTSLFLPIAVDVLGVEGWKSVSFIELILTLILFNALAALGGDLAEREILEKERYRTLNHLSEQFGHKLNIDELAHVILTETVRALQAESGELWLGESDGHRCRLIAHEGSVPVAETPPTSENTLTLVEWMLRYNKLLCVENPEVNPHFIVTPTQPPIRDVLATPLRSSGIPFGALVLYNRQFRTFLQRDIDLLTEIAIKSETALENAQLYHTLEERVLERTRDLAEEKNKLAVVFQSIADGLAVLDPDQRILLVNPVVARVLNRDADSLVGELAWEVFPSPALKAVVTRALATRESVAAADVVLPTGMVLRASVGLLNGPSDEGLGVVMVLRDITHELEITRMKTDFVTMVSHELRTPLTGILGFARLIQKQLVQFPPDKLAPGNLKWARAAQRIENNLNVITSEGEQLTHLITDVLDIARLEDGRIEWEMHKIGLPEIIASNIAGIQDAVYEKGLSIAVDVPLNLPPVMGDRGRLAQVLENLLANALKFTDRGVITVKVWRLAPGDDIFPMGARPSDTQTGLPATQPMLAVSIQDTGVGIAEADLLQVFEKFKQAGNLQAGTRRRGTGLGLPICREIIFHHGGHIWVESRLGEGSRFVFTIPVQ
ncbi:MAG: PAS domain-containing protein [Anaerolineae bacterium]|nr:PAS domain-containing protein [Anaerolineae bacterium]